MEYFFVGMCILGVALFILHLYRNKTKKNSLTKTLNPIDTSISCGIAMRPMELLSIKEQINESDLIEINDENIISRIVSLIPGTAEALKNVTVANSVRNVAQHGGFYQAFIPSGATLDKSRDMAGAFRGTYRYATNSIKSHANFKPANEVALASAATNITNALMNVGTMVVGQYYMSQISSELGKMSKEIEQIASFQENEYKSKVYSLIEQVQKIATFQIETIENNEVRNRALINLQNAENECTILLGQANLTISNYVCRCKLKFDEYERLVVEANSWYQFQQVLIRALYKIGDLTYTLNLGQLSREHCYAMYSEYLKQTDATINQLSEWHNCNSERFGINVNQYNRKRVGFDKAVHWIPSLIDENKAHRPISEKMGNMIKSQQSKGAYNYFNDSKLFESDVRIIVKDGKLYYLPEKNNEEEN